MIPTRIEGCYRSTGRQAYFSLNLELPGTLHEGDWFEGLRIDQATWTKEGKIIARAQSCTFDLEILDENIAYLLKLGFEVTGS